MRWLMRVLTAILTLGTLAGCYASGAERSEAPSWCVTWRHDEYGGEGWCSLTKEQAQEDYNAARGDAEYDRERANAGSGSSGNRFDCDDFNSRAAAQAHLDAYPNDPNY